MRFAHQSKRLGYVVTLGAAAVAMASFVVLSTWSSMPAGAVSSQEIAGAIPSAALDVGGSPAVPTASSVFSGRPYLAEEHVEAF